MLFVCFLLWSIKNDWSSSLYCGLCRFTSANRSLSSVKLKIGKFYWHTNTTQYTAGKWFSSFFMRKLIKKLSGGNLPSIGREYDLGKIFETLRYLIGYCGSSVLNSQRLRLEKVIINQNYKHPESKVGNAHFTWRNLMKFHIYFRFPLLLVRGAKRLLKYSIIWDIRSV